MASDSPRIAEDSPQLLTFLLSLHNYLLGSTQQLVGLSLEVAIERGFWRETWMTQMFYISENRLSLAGLALGM